MRIAAYIHQNQPGVGLVSDNLKEVRPYPLQAHQCALGALPLVEAMARGEALPAPGAAVPLEQVRLTDRKSVV